MNLANWGWDQVCRSWDRYLKKAESCSKPWWDRLAMKEGEESEETNSNCWENKCWLACRWYWAARLVGLELSVVPPSPSWCWCCWLDWSTSILAYQLNQLQPFEVVIVKQSSMVGGLHKSRTSSRKSLLHFFASFPVHLFLMLARNLARWVRKTSIFWGNHRFTQLWTRFSSLNSPHPELYLEPAALVIYFPKVRSRPSLLY